ncbi:MAG: glycosyltransferase family 2 protein [Erysipelotrichaceae bacterium]|nr:glycosyltransferase family 2 protein [Erysipelotrichaceae bacterium]
MISVVIPCYRSERSLRGVVEKTIETLKEREKAFEIVLVNDGSPDNVWNVIEDLVKENKKFVKGINFTKNFGQHAALLAGYKYSKGDIIVSMDDDGQTNPAYLWKLVDRLNEGGFDVVYAKYPQTKETLFRRMGSWLNNKMSEVLLNKPKEVKGTSFYAIRRYVVEDMVRYDKSYPYIGGLVYRATSNIGDVEIEHQERESGSSGYTLRKLINLTLNGFTAFSVVPLRIASFLGVFCAFAGFIYAIVIIIRKLTDPSIQLGYSSLMAAILFIGGLIMFLLGLIGEYVGRIYIGINNQPQYVIKERIGNE